MRGRRGRGREVGFGLLTRFGAVMGLLVLLLLVGDIFVDGVGNLTRHFFTGFASRFPERAGIRAPLLGTAWLLGLTALLVFPVSVGAAIYLEEYASKRWTTRALQTFITNLAGVPSIVYGLLGLALFVRGLGLDRSVLAGGLTLSLLIMPVVILSCQEALRRVPSGVREAAFGLGATRWQVLRHQVLPQALPDMVSGGIFALSRAVGEAAPLIMIGAVTFIAFTPESVSDPFTALPVQIFHWAIRPQAEFRELAAAAIIVLLALMLGMNALAVAFRTRLERKSEGRRKRK